MRHLKNQVEKIRQATVSLLSTMKFADPSTMPEAPEDNHVLLEEYKIVVEDRRFAITRFMQGVAFYLAIIGLVAREYFQLGTDKARLFFLLFAFTVNCVAWLAAGRFKSMAEHALYRESLLAEKLRVQAGHPLTWGYTLSMILGSFVQMAVTVELLRVMFWP